VPGGLINGDVTELITSTIGRIPVAFMEDQGLPAVTVSWDSIMRWLSPNGSAVPNANVGSLPT